VYQSAVDNSLWTYNGTTYVTYTAPSSTAWFTAGTTNDAGNSKTSNIYRTGNVGIGTLTTPLHLLHLQTTSQARMFFESTDGTNGQASIDLRVGNAQWWRTIGQGSSNGGRYEIWNQTANNSAFNITPSNNVGIGTQSPTAHLEVATMNGLSAIIRRGGSALQTPANLILQKTTGTNANAAGAVTNGDFVGRILFSASNGASYPTNGTDIVGYAVGTQSAANNGGGIFFRTVPLNSVGQSLERMRIEHNGNVGIGTSTPNSRFEVVSASTDVARFTTSLTGTNYAGVGIGNASGVWGKIASGEGKFQIRNFSTDATIINAELGTGNVGIGTTSPGSRLEVNGSATNTTAFNAAAGTTINFANSNLAYTTASPGAFIIQGMKDGGTYTLAVQGTTSGTASFSSSGFTFLSANNGATIAGKQTLYTFVVMGTTVYVYMATGF
jgi:hypothetical protein